MHITILALGSRGDIQPYAALGSGLQQAGHQVRFITFASFANIVAAHGLAFHPIQGDAQALVTTAGANMIGLIRSFGSLARGYAQDLSASHLGATDLILNQLPIGLYGYDLAEKHGVPMALAAVIPLTRTQTFPLVGFPNLPLPGLNKITYYLGEQMAWQMFRTVINRWRKETLGLRPQSWRGYMNRLGTPEIPTLNGFSRHVVPRPDDWGESVHVTGYWFPEDKQWQPPSNLLAFLEAGPPPIFIGFGSMPVKNPAQTTTLILKALEQTGQRGILHMGWGGLGQATLPDPVFQIEYAPYGWLFPRMAMIIHHGGSGTTGFGVRAGIPSCIVPFVFDQFYWGQRLAALGVAPQPIPFKQLTTARLSAAIHQGVSDAQMCHKAAALGHKVQAERGIESVVALISTLTQ